MKLSEFIKQFDGIEDFEVEIILRDNKQDDAFPSYNVFEVIVRDIGYSSKVIRLGIGKEI